MVFAVDALIYDIQQKKNTLLDREKSLRKIVVRLKNEIINGKYTAVYEHKQTKCTCVVFLRFWFCIINQTQKRTNFLPTKF